LQYSLAIRADRSRGFMVRMTLFATGFVVWQADKAKRNIMRI
jgi:hypothetical protein